MSEHNRPWYRELNSYHWFVFVVAALGWLFDTMDQQLFNLVRRPACTELLNLSPTDSAVDKYGGYATSVFLVGWAIGGIFFGVLGDRIGRAKTMVWTILIYSLCTGLSAASRTVWDFALYRFLTGLGVGGEFAVGVALVAEVMPQRARPFALGLLQALSAVGNISAALISLGLGHLEETGVVASAWRATFLVGTVPALLALLVRRRLKEPERWQATAVQGEVARKLGSYSELFRHPRWRKDALVGLALAFSGVVGLWGIGFFSIDLNRLVFRRAFEQEARDQGEAKRDRRFLQALIASPERVGALSDQLQPATLISPDADSKDAERVFWAVQQLQKSGQTVSLDNVLDWLDNGDNKIPAQSAEVRTRRAVYLQGDSGEPNSLDDEVAHIRKRGKVMNGRLSFWAAMTSVMLNIGAFFGIYAFSVVTHRLGRRLTFAIGFVAAALSTALVFGYMQNIFDVFWMVPIMGFCQLSLFGGYAIYFPELFPTHLRSTGTSFCYNVGRLVAAAGPSALGVLTNDVFHDKPEPMRWAGVTMCGVFLLGLLALPFAPETKGQPLPE